MEANILLDIDFAVNIPTTRDFLLFYIHEAQISHKDVIKLSENIIHTLLTDLDILKFLPSMIAASALVVSNKILDIEDIYPEKLVEISGYRFTDLTECIDFVNKKNNNK